MKEFRLKPRFLPYVEGTCSHAFQIEILKVQEQVEDCLIVEAPTGAGKTQVLGEMSDLSRGSFAPVLLVVSPTNALSTQIKRDVESENPAMSVVRWAASEFVNSPWGRNLELVNSAMTANVVVSNPDILHLFTQNYYVRRSNGEPSTRQRTFDDAMARFGVHFFDEYHSYDERMMASVLCYMLKARSLPTCRHHKYVFLSATPNRSLPPLLDEFGFTYRAIKEMDSDIEIPNGRPIKKELLVRLAPGDVIDHVSSLPRPGSMRPRTLVLMDSYVKEERLLAHLLSVGYTYRTGSDADVVPLTGRDTKSEQGQLSWEKSPLIIATSKAELGLNIDDLEQLIMEPGRFTSQFLQRFGRAGRSRESTVTIVVPAAYERLITDCAVGDLEGLVGLITKLSSERPFSIDKCLRYVGYQMATAEILTGKMGLRNLIHDIQLPGISSHARSLLMISERRLASEFPKDFAHDVTAILARLVTSFCLLRGQSTDVDCEYPRGTDTLRTKDNLLFILSRTDAEALTTNDGCLYRIKAFLDEPRDAVVSFPGFPNPVCVRASKGYVGRPAWQGYVTDLIGAMVKKSISGERGDALSAFEKVLTSIDTDMMAPLEVSIDDQFI